MRTFLKLFLAALAWSGVSLAQAQPTSRAATYRELMAEVMKNPPRNICYLDHGVDNTRIPPPKAYYDRMAALARGRTESAQFIVDYQGFPPEAQAAFQRAVDIWASLITSPEPIRIRAEWATLGDNVLGGARATNWLRSPLLPRFPVWYPVALFEKITGRNTNGNDPDIVASFNSSNRSWYFGSDGRPASNQYDFTTVVLHEIGHGLGFASSFEITGDTNNQATYGFGAGIANTFDQFIADQQNRRLTDTVSYNNPSTQLRTAITSANLFFDSPLARSANANQPPRLYAPRTYERGSSVSHLDTETFNRSVDQLMVHAQSRGESTLDPGPITMGILNDMGWVVSRLDHQPIANSNRPNAATPIRVQLFSDTLRNFNNVVVNLFYSTDRFRTSQTVRMQAGAGGVFTAQIPGAAENRTINYYAIATLPGGTQLTSPGGAPRYSWYFAANGTDNAAPIISHEAPRFILETETDFAVLTNVRDDLGIDTVLVEYRVNNNPLTTVAALRAEFSGFFSQPAGSFPSIGVNSLSNGNGDFAARLNLVGLRDGDMLNYRIIARDRAATPNQGTLPATGFFQVQVRGFGEVRDQYTNNFNGANAANDFIGTDFRIEQPRGFETPAIHSDHPYRDGSGANSESNYVYLLRFPIRVGANNSAIRFDEIVLVEPGEAGTVFGDFEFWDYVVVEGSNDRGRTWQPLAAGYDSRDRAEWLTAWNRNVRNGNSTTEGTAELFRTRNLEIGRVFRPGEQVLIRFRLFADQSANGWGWAIDNLQIQTPVLGLDEFLASPEAVRVGPNPSQGRLQVTAEFKKPVPSLGLRITDLLGRIVYTEAPTAAGVQYRKEVALPPLAAGLYLLSLDLDGRSVTRQIMVE
ncbi:MAG: T9SS type A sorting domain-containing protein [Bernardetiaceae bacterium]|jgi:hypothetical protein|nr:T9SS type A sorting domain-containing protein [Bernardetiaceae bacterium]